MTIQYCSDLHLEFYENREFLKENPLQVQGDILLLAGDIIPFPEMDKHKTFFNEMADKFEQVYWIPGNHEYYHFDAAKKMGMINERIRNNFSLVNNITLHQGKVRFIFSTLWSAISPGNEWDISREMNDFRLIKYNQGRFTTTQYNEFHAEAVNFIKEEVNKEHEGETFVVTHHVPTLLNYPEQYKGSSLSEGFAVELFNFIESSKIDYWLYGHHHANIPEFRIEKTLLLTNQLGYVNCNEHLHFDTGKNLRINKAISVS